MTDRLRLYGKPGAAYLDVHDTSFPTTARSGFGANLLMSGQLKAKLWQNARKDFLWDGSVQYIYIGAPHKRKGNQARWNEWQFATRLAKTFGRLEAYLGVKLSFLQVYYRLRNQNIQTSSRYRPDSLVGPFLGLDCHLGENADTILTIEGSYLQGAEITIAISKRF